MWDCGFPASCAQGDTLMDNFVLFILGVSITLISTMGVLVYCVSLGYKKPNYEKQEDPPIIKMSKTV
jgi:hypothetical protein